MSDRLKTLVLTLTTTTLILGSIPPLPGFAQSEILYDCVTETDRGRRERQGLNRAMAWGYLGNDVAEDSRGILSSWRGKCTPRNGTGTPSRQSNPSPSSRPSPTPQPSSQPSPTSSQPSTSTGLLNSCQSEVAARLAGTQASNVRVESSSVDAGGNAIVNWNSPAGQSGFCRVDPFGNIIEFRQN